MKLPFTLALALLGLSVSSNAEKRVIQPRENSPFSQGILVDGTLYVAGQQGRDLKTGKMPEKFEDEVKNTLEHIGQILHDANMDYSDVVSVQVFLTDLSLYRQMNAVYVTYFKTNRPVRATLGVASLVGEGSHIEIMVQAHH